MSSDDGYVQGAPDSTGKKIDTSEITREGPAQEVVERQRVEVYDDNGDAVSSAAIVEQLKEMNGFLWQILSLLQAKDGLNG